MSRPNPAVLMGILLAVLAALGGAAAMKGGFYIGKHEGDNYHMMDIVFRMVAGELPHIDFMTPIGGLAFAPIAFFVWLGQGIGTAVIWSQILMAALMLVPLWWVSQNRLSPGLAALFGLLVLTLVLALVPGESQRSVSISMHYNRWAWGAAYIAILTAVLPPVNSRSGVADGIVVGLMLAILALIKATYFAAFVLPIALSLWLTGQRRALGVGIVTGAVIAGVLTLWLGVEYWLAYLGDLLAVARSDVRPQPGEPLMAVIGAPAYLGGSLVAVAGVILLRQARARVGGLILLLLLPGFAYVTFQNFGNDPQWLPLLAIQLLGLRPMGEVTNGFGWNMRNALNICAAMALALSAVSFSNLLYSPFRHLRINIADYSPLLVDAGPHSDFHTPTIRALRIDARVALDEEGLFAPLRESALRDETPEFMGESFSSCYVELGLPGFYDSIADDLAEAGYANGAKLFVADLFSSFWLFADFGRLEGGAPWYYGGLPGYEDADYLLVPICPVTQDLQFKIIAALKEHGTDDLTEVRRTSAYILYKIGA